MGEVAGELGTGGLDLAALVLRSTLGGVADGLGGAALEAAELAFGSSGRSCRGVFRRSSTKIDGRAWGGLIHDEDPKGCGIE